MHTDTALLKITNSLYTSAVAVADRKPSRNLAQGLNNQQKGHSIMQIFERVAFSNIAESNTDIGNAWKKPTTYDTTLSPELRTKTNSSRARYCATLYCMSCIEHSDHFGVACWLALLDVVGGACLLVVTRNFLKRKKAYRSGNEVETCRNRWKPIRTRKKLPNVRNERKPIGNQRKPGDSEALACETETHPPPSIEQIEVPGKEGEHHTIGAGG